MARWGVIARGYQHIMITLSEFRVLEYLRVAICRYSLCSANKMDGIDQKIVNGRWLYVPNRCSRKPGSGQLTLDDRGLGIVYHRQSRRCGLGLIVDCSGKIKLAVWLTSAPLLHGCCIEVSRSSAR